tara:strand:+ start:142 stop:249 length:108 start_codon:yes stop_codon:yes gene_type:complete
MIPNPMYKFEKRMEKNESCKTGAKSTKDVKTIFQW